MTTSFKSVLSKIGQVLLTAGSVATEVMGFPFLSGLLGATPAGKVVEIGMQAIAPTDKSGSAKLTAAIPMVKQVILSWAQSNLPGHSSLKVDAQTFDTHVGNFTSSFVDLMNDFGD